MDREIEEQLRQVDQIKASLGESPVRLKLKAMCHLAKAPDPQHMHNHIEFIPL